MTQKFHAVVVAALGCMAVAGIGAQQTPPKAAPARPGAAKAAGVPAYKAIATIQELMSGTVDPTSKAIFAAVSSEATAKGSVETAPKNDAEWFIVRRNALALAETANLLLIPGRHFAVPENATKHADGELSPAVIEIRVSKDRAQWNRFAVALREAAMAAVTAAQAKRKEDFGEVNEMIDTACETCHVYYWYPDQVELLENAAKLK